MNQCILLNQGQPLDFEAVRLQVTRIPEVMQRLRQAQEIWDSCEDDRPSVNFFETLISDDKAYFSSRTTRSLLTAIVQLGLYDRLMRRSSQASVLIGNIRNDSVVKVICGQLSFAELIGNNSVSATKAAGSLQLLQGQEFARFQAFEWQNGQYKSVGESNESLEELMAWVAENKHVKKFISVGPGSVDISKSRGLLSEVSLAESIDNDPMLGWFWQNVKAASA